MASSTRRIIVVFSSSVMSLSLASNTADAGIVADSDSFAAGSAGSAAATLSTTVAEVSASTFAATDASSVTVDVVVVFTASVVASVRFTARVARRTFPGWRRAFSPRRHL